MADIKDALRREHEADVENLMAKCDRLNAELTACQKDKKNLETQNKNWETSYEQLRRETLKYRDEVTKSFKALQTEYERLNGALLEEKKRGDAGQKAKLDLEEKQKS